MPRPLNWHRWLESNQQAAVLETAPAPLPHRHKIGLTDRICPGVFLLHRQAPHYSATANTRWSHAPDLNRHPCATRARCSPEPRGWRDRCDSNAQHPPYQSGVQPLELRPRTNWRARRDLNPQQLGYEPSSLPLDFHALKWRR